MDSHSILVALILGVVEGFTEFLPISSTGHLIIVGDLLQFNDERGKVFEIFIQLGAILAVCWAYRTRIRKVAGGLRSDPAAQKFVLNILIAFTPAVILGLLFHKAIKAYLFNPITVACALIVGGIVILLIERRRTQPTILTIDELNWKDALKIGFAQTLAMFPGVSRSGATIMGGLMFGLSRTAATEFSFFLAIPTMFAATTYDLYKNWALLQQSDLPLFALGFFAAFLSALAAVKTLLKYLANHTFSAFAWYRIIFGSVVLLYYWNR